MKTLFTTLLLTLAFIHARAQESDAFLVKNFLITSDSFANVAEYKSAILYQKRALNLLQTQTPVPYPKLVSVYRSIGFYYRLWGKFSESLFYQKKAVQIAESKLDKNHIELAKAYNSYGSYFNGIGQYNKSFEYFNKALQISLKAKLPTVGDYYNNVGIAQQNLGNLDASLKTYQKSLDYNRSKYGIYSSKAADNFENMGTVFFKLGRYDDAIVYLDTTEIILDSIYEQGSPYFASLYNNLGAVYTTKGDHRKALKYLEEGLKLYERYLGSEHPDVANIYANTGLLLQDRGELDKALAYLHKAQSIREMNFGKDNPQVARTHLYLGNCYLEKNIFDKAFEHLNTGLATYTKLNSRVDPGSIAHARNELGLYYEKIKNYKEALKQYNKALEINSKKLELNDPDVANSYARIGKIYLEQKKYEEANSFFSKALKIRIKAFGKKHTDVADAYRLLALSCPEDEACFSEYIDAAFASINYKNGNNFESVFSPIGLLNIFQAEGSLNYGFYKKTKKDIYLEKADHIYSNAIELISFIKTSLEQPGSRLALQDNYYLIYEEAILVKHKLKELNNDIKYWKEAFAIAEKSNAILLIEAVQTIDAERFAGIPDSLVEIEQQLKVDLSFLEKQRFEEEIKPAGSDQKILKEINDRILELHSRQHELISYFKKNHEEYFKLKYDPKIVSIKKIQTNLLRPDQTMLAYFVGENNLFAFVISKNNFEVVQIKKDFPLEIWVEEFRNSIYRFNPADNSLVYLNQKLANIGYELYQLIFEPVEKSISTDALIIVPGGVLGYLPFDALLASPTENYNDFDNLDYLINKYKISYSYSATLLEEMKKGKRKSSPLIAFAPAYFGDTLNVNRSNNPWRAVLGQLRFNAQEAIKIHEIMGGELYLDSMATEAKFMERAPYAGILHLATHGKANDRHGEYSYLAFYQFQDSIENELLFVKNLYNMHIPASLVVLSACETGIGELQRGEGIVSLSRGFSYAGAASIVTTQWSIDDNASATIMVSFYKNLKNGQTKDVALRNAKLAYIKANKGNNRTHPLFWAAFVPVGNMDALEMGWPWWVWTLIGITVFGVLWFLKNRSVSRRK
ncbi:MAG TPA: tetratricopeptide repeat protein [Bacteroidetes bacterium]|nr:tetratricopeptide repeat protein [Bacteroidota bacterium]